MLNVVTKQELSPFYQDRCCGFLRHLVEASEHCRKSASHVKLFSPQWYKQYRYKPQRNSKESD